MWDFFREFLYDSILKHPNEQEDSHEIENRVALRHGAIDVLYFLLGFFTNVYGVTITVIFFGGFADTAPVLVQLLSAFQEPYLGGLAVYVVLKEIRKRRNRAPSRHYGELFVFFWMFLLITSTFSILFFDGYYFDETYKLIITNAFAAFVVYIGGLINRP